MNFLLTDYVLIKIWVSNFMVCKKKNQFNYWNISRYSGLKNMGEKYLKNHIFHFFFLISILQTTLLKFFLFIFIVKCFIK